LLRDIGVIWFEVTGGEPLIDPNFIDTSYERAHAAGMLVVAGELWLTQIRRTDSGLSARTVLDHGRTFTR
jgi:hypothetical protein